MRKAWTLTLIIVIIILVGIAAYLFGRNQEKESLQTEAIITPEVKTALPSTIMITQGVTLTPTADSPVVVIESEGSIPAQDLSELKLRVINPYLDYHAESQPGTLISFKVSPNLLESKTSYPYTADAVFKNGGNEGFLISKTNGHINWFIPECLNGCNLSESYKAKYPEIAKQLE